MSAAASCPDPGRRSLDRRAGAVVGDDAALPEHRDRADGLAVVARAVEGEEGARGAERGRPSCALGRRQARSTPRATARRPGARRRRMRWYWRLCSAWARPGRPGGGSPPSVPEPPFGEMSPSFPFVQTFTTSWSPRRHAGLWPARDLLDDPLGGRRVVAREEQVVVAERRRVDREVRPHAIGWPSGSSTRSTVIVGSIEPPRARLVLRDVLVALERLEVAVARRVGDCVCDAERGPRYAGRDDRSAMPSAVRSKMRGSKTSPPSSA